MPGGAPPTLGGAGGTFGVGGGGEPGFKVTWTVSLFATVGGLGVSHYSN